MNNTLQIEIDPLLCAEQGRIFEGQINTKDMPRIVGEVGESATNIQVILEFSRRNKIIVVTGRISGNLMLQCAACLEAIDFPIDINLNLAIVNDDSLIGVLPEGLDPKVVEDGKLMLSDVVEDELVLALPDIARHDECPIELPTVSASADFVEEVNVKVNPFKVLEGFKKD